MSNVKHQTFFYSDINFISLSLYQQTNTMATHIIKETENYRGEKYYMLISEGSISISRISEKRMSKFLERGIALDDSEKIERYLKYNNL